MINARQLLAAQESAATQSSGRTPDDDTWRIEQDRPEAAATSAPS